MGEEGGELSDIFCEGYNFCDILFAFLCTKTLLKRVYSKRKEFARSRKVETKSHRVISTKSVSRPLNMYR